MFISCGGVTRRKKKYCTNFMFVKKCFRIQNMFRFSIYSIHTYTNGSEFFPTLEQGQTIFKITFVAIIQHHAVCSLNRKLRYFQFAYLSESLEHVCVCVYGIIQLLADFCPFKIINSTIQFIA